MTLTRLWVIEYTFIHNFFSVQNDKLNDNNEKEKGGIGLLKMKKTEYVVAVVVVERNYDLDE